MSEIGTLAAMASSPRALRAAVRDTKTILGLSKISLSPSPSDGVATPDLPRMFQLDDKKLKEFLPGTLLLTNGNEVRYVPIENPIRERAGGYQFRVVSARRFGQEERWDDTIYMSRTAAEKGFQAAILGVCSEPRGKGRLSELVRDKTGDVVSVEFTTPRGDVREQLDLVLSNGCILNGTSELLFNMTNLRAWEDYPLRPPAPAPLPTVRALERATIPFAALEEERSPKAIFTTLAAVGMISNDTEGVSALAMALLLQGAAGHPDAEHAYDDARGPAAAIAAASHVSAGRRSTRSTPAKDDNSEVGKRRIRTGKTLINAAKALIGALSPAQIATLAAHTRDLRAARGGREPPQHDIALSVGQRICVLEDELGPIHYDAAAAEPAQPSGGAEASAETQNADRAGRIPSAEASPPDNDNPHRRSRQKKLLGRGHVWPCVPAFKADTQQLDNQSPQGISANCNASRVLVICVQIITSLVSNT